MKHGSKVRGGSERAFAVAMVEGGLSSPALVQGVQNVTDNLGRYAEGSNARKGSVRTRI